MDERKIAEQGNIRPTEGHNAPRDPETKRKGFYLMRKKEIAGSPWMEGKGVQFLFLDNGRIDCFARIVGNIEDDGILELLHTAEGFRKLVHSIGITMEMTEGESREAEFILQMYGKRDPNMSGTQIRVPVAADGMEQVIELADFKWSEDDAVPGQIRFEFPAAGVVALVSVKLYLQEGFEVPEEIPDEEADLESPYYKKMLEKSLIQTGNPARLQRAIDRARQGEDVTVAFIGGSITQGAGAIPISRECYAWRTFERFCSLVGKGTEENIHYIKAGVGGTPSELGMLRYERDVLRDGSVKPDVVVVEFAVNDEDDETKGECYDSLVRKILVAENAPAVILLFAVFVDDWNLQERLSPVGRAYDLPMVSVRDAVVEQFYKKPGEGKVFGKSLFFYDRYHPTNLGHRVMTDCIGYLLQTVDEMPRQEDTLEIASILPPLGGEFETVKLYDRKSQEDGILVDCGSFCEWDQELQAVEMDRSPEHIKQFSNNWKYNGGEKGDLRSFSMDITCSALLLIYKDSASSAVGRAEVWVDGEKVLTADPNAVGWIHCHPAICFRGRETARHHVEVCIEPGCEDKEFTILGFGYVA